jgi:hypothetical protein
MAKKNWIYIKRGLSEDPKHREAMGMAVWLFEKGIVYDWRDKEIAIDMSISTNTVRDWRARLVEKKYITCQQRQHGLDIIIHNWTNPRDYGGKKVNIQGESYTAPSENNHTQGEPQGEPQVLHPSNIDSAPFIESESESESKAGGVPPSVFEKANKEVDFILRSTLQPKAIQDAIARHFKLTPQWEGSKFNRQWMQWAIEQNVTPEQIEQAAKLWGGDKRFNWSHPNLKGIQEHWLELVPQKESPARDQNFRPMPTYIDGVPVWETTK